MTSVDLRVRESRMPVWGTKEMVTLRSWYTNILRLAPDRKRQAIERGIEQICNS